MDHRPDPLRRRQLDKHSLVLAPAERADVVVDFSKFAGKTLILYNDAPAAYPARVPSYDYYTGAPDLSPVGAPKILPGYGPNTRTVMQVKIADTTAAPAFDVAKLRSAFQHKANGSGVFESGQNPTIVGQAAYNSAYGTSFAASSNCNVPNSTKQTCDGLVRVDDHTTFGFNTLKAPNAKMSMHVEPKAIHDEMNATTFDEFGRMQANLGVEAQPPTPGLQNVTLYPYVNPQTELIDGTNLPTADVKVKPISTASDGTQIWRFTHNGVDTHPIHFHLYDVQVLNRVTWDNIVIPADDNELGWKDTVRMSPLEDTIVALRPVVPTTPFEVPNSVRNLNPMMPTGSTAGFNPVDVQGNPTANIVNDLVNFGWEYVFHCHILSHEEMDMMRPVSLAVPPRKPDGLTLSVTGSGKNRHVTASWNDNSITETSYVLQRSSNGTAWTDVATSTSPLDQPNRHGTRTLTDPSSNPDAAYRYRVVARNTVGYGGQFPSMTAQSMTDEVGYNTPAAPSNLTATLQTGPRVSLTWRDNATNESGFSVERSADNGATFTQIATPAARSNTGSVTFVDTTAVLGQSYQYRVSAVNVAGRSAPSNTVTVDVKAPDVPTGLTGSAVRQGGNERVTLRWIDLTNESSYTVQWSTSSAFTTVAGSATVGADTTTHTTGNIARQTWYFRIRATNALGTSNWSTGVQVAAAP